MLAEIVRIAKPGGSIGIFDGDYASLTFGHPDPDQGKRDDEALIAAIVTNPRVMRQMPVLVHEAGLELVASFPYVLAEVGKADFWLPAIESFRKLMPTAGAMTAAEASAWADRLTQASDVGPFLRRQQLLRIRPAQAAPGLTPSTARRCHRFRPIHGEPAGREVDVESWQIPTERGVCA